MELAQFVLLQLPHPPVRVLEIGCGKGELARALANAGYDVLAIDPEAPEGSIFRRTTLEELDARGPFDAVVASVSLHHIHDLEAALDKILGMLRPDGVLDLNEFGHDRLDDATADWYWGHLRALAAARGTTAPATLDQVKEEWAREHEACTATRRCGTSWTLGSTSATSHGSRTSSTSLEARRPRSSSAR
jgi:ubiquinone/menaquinone biosynthesis C-methylase UbiE